MNGNLFVENVIITGYFKPTETKTYYFNAELQVHIEYQALTPRRPQQCSRDLKKRK